MARRPGPFFPIREVDEVAFAMTLFVSAASFKLPAPEVEQWELPNCDCATVFSHVVELMRRAGNTSTIRTGERTLQFAFMSLWRHYEYDDRQQSICARVLGFHSLMVLTKGAIVEPWLTCPEETPEVVLLHPAVVEAVATTSLGASGLMAEPDFLRTLARVAISTAA